MVGSVIVEVLISQVRLGAPRADELLGRYLEPGLRFALSRRGETDIVAGEAAEILQRVYTSIRSGEIKDYAQLLQCLGQWCSHHGNTLTSHREGRREVSVEELQNVIEALGGETRHALRRYYVDGDASQGEEERFQRLRSQLRAFQVKGRPPQNN